MSTPDQNYREKLRARADGRAPVLVQPVVVPEGATADERHKAKLATRLMVAKQPAPVTENPEAKADVKAETDQGRKAAEAAELAAIEEATKPEAKADVKGNRPSK